MLKFLVRYLFNYIKLKIKWFLLKSAPNIMDVTAQTGAVLPYPAMLGSLNERLRSALRSNFLTDVGFVVGPNQELRNAHKLVLAVCSEVFWVMLFGSLSKNSNKPISIPDVDVDAFDIMISFAYTREVELQSVKNAINVAYASKKYMIQDLFNIAVRYLEAQKTISTVCEIFRTSILLDIEKLKESCLCFINRNGVDVLKTEGFACLPEDVVLSVSSSVSKSVNSSILFRALINWASHNASSTETCPSTSSSPNVLRERLMPFLPSIRFLSLTTKEFLMTVSGSQVLTDSEMLAIVCNIENCQVNKPLPDWCNMLRNVAKALTKTPRGQPKPVKRLVPTPRRGLRSNKQLI